MEQSATIPRPTLEQLRHVAENFPIIDSHTRNLILPQHANSIPFESITTEAQGRALRDTFKSLPHLRAAKQLRKLYQCDEDADWEDILEQRIEWYRSDSQQIHRKCFEGVHALLVDDGIAGPEKVYPYDSHDGYLKGPSKRIVRIETVAECLMERIVRDAKEDDLGKTKFLPDTWVEFTDEFEREIQDAIKDPEVVGFKTVVCYRTGLDIEPDYEQAARAVGHPFERYVKNCIRKRSYRIERKQLNDYLVLRTLEILSEDLPHGDPLSKPLQIHTGLGDNDINLLESNPAYLQQVIEAYPNVPFVLLHSAYPFTQQAGYLATVYRHVYLDVGEVFPMVSRDGQRAILRQALELVPGSKLLYSSDGHWFPETFYLANVQFREVWLELLVEYIDKGDLTVFQAIHMTKDILFNNANILYKLRYDAIFDETVPDFPKQLTYNHKTSAASSHPSPGTAPIPPAGMTGEPATAGPVDPRSGSPYEPPSFPPPPTAPHVYDQQVFNEFMKQNSDIRFIYVQWLDYMATMRTRIVPIKEFTRLIHEGDRIGVSQGNTGTLQNDGLTPVVNTTGQIYIEPDLRSLRRTHSKDPLPSATVLSYWRSEDGSPLSSCPRNNLETLINQLQYTHSTTLLIGFEIEVTFLSRDANITNPFSTTSTNTSHDPFTPLTKTHAWGTMSPNQWLQLPFLTETLLALDQMGIDMQQLHAAPGPGQYKFILAPLPPLLAIDTLLQARQTIAQIASLHNLRATLHPNPFNNTRTAAHTHISLHPPDHDMQFFFGGVLPHLPALCAFTLPSPASYTHDDDDDDAARTHSPWLAWGTQNHAVPLRRARPGRWEFRCLDGLANMYFAMAGIVAAGLLGLAADAHDFAQRDVRGDPAALGDDERARLGVGARLPRSVGEALEALERDGGLGEGLGERVVRDYVVMKRREVEMLGGMGEGERRVFLMERY